MNKLASTILASALMFALPVSAEDAAGDWIGVLNSGFKVRVHIDKIATGYSGDLINPSATERISIR